MARYLTRESWLARQLEGAPADLADRTVLFAGDPAVDGAPDALAAAAIDALEAAIAQAQERSAALDLLAADALVTLALAAQAERDASQLEGFARALRRADRKRDPAGTGP